MSFAKYAQFYKDNGFFAGSKIKTTVTDGTFVGEQLVLSKGNTILKTTTIPTSGKVEFFTDESGELLLSADNGTSTLSGSVTITSYATYNVTLHGTASDNKREAYANDVTMDKDTAEATVAYTGDKSSMSIVVSDHKLIKAQIDGEKIKITDGGYDKKGRCSITATIAETENYTSADVTFYVNKIIGEYGSWQDAPDEVIASMIAKADAGEIYLPEFWNIGDTRTVHISAINEGEEVSAQPEQDIELVILHNPNNSDLYRLEEPTSGYRYQPSFIIGTKNCLDAKTSVAYVPKTITEAYYSQKSVATLNAYVSVDDNNESEIFSFLNDDVYGFVSALPEYLKNAIKSTYRTYCSGSIFRKTSTGSGNYTHTDKKIVARKVDIANVQEVFGTSITVTADNKKMNNVVGTYINSGNNGYLASSPITTYNATMNGKGLYFDYYKTTSNRKKNRGNSEIATDYSILETSMYASATNDYQGGKDIYPTCIYAMAFYINSDGVLSTNNLSSEAQRKAQRGVSPIMFI